MLPKRLNILIADDDEGDRQQIKRALKQAEMRFICTDTSSIEDAMAACEKCTFDCALIDYRLPGQDGLAGISSLHERFPNMAIIMVTGQGDERVATEAMKRGALDYIPKITISGASIRRSVESALEKARLLLTIAKQRTELEIFSRVSHDEEQNREEHHDRLTCIGSETGACSPSSAVRRRIKL